MESITVREIIVNYKYALKTKSLAEPREVAKLVRKILPNNSQEHGIAIYLDSQHRPISYSILSSGLENCVVIPIRQLLQKALLCGAVSLILAHNHPSESEQESKEDIAMTKNVYYACEIVGIRMLDHIIVTNDGFNSLAQYMK